MPWEDCPFRCTCSKFSDAQRPLGAALDVQIAAYQVAKGIVGSRVKADEAHKIIVATTTRQVIRRSGRHSETTSTLWYVPEH